MSGQKIEDMKCKQCGYAHPVGSACPPNSSLPAPAGSAATYATKTEIAKCAALTAANFIEKGHWVEAYIELHSAARICWERREEERQQPNGPHKPSGEEARA